MCPSRHSDQLADVEDLDSVAALRELLDGPAREALDLAALGAPARHAAGEEAAEPADPDGGGEPPGNSGVVVVAPDEHDLLLAVRDPGELRAEALRAAS